MHCLPPVLHRGSSGGTAAAALAGSEMLGLMVAQQMAGSSLLEGAAADPSARQAREGYSASALPRRRVGLEATGPSRRD
jgi:hypothetical protein